MTEVRKWTKSLHSVFEFRSVMTSQMIPKAFHFENKWVSQQISRRNKGLKDYLGRINDMQFFLNKAHMKIKKQWCAIFFQ